MQNEKEFRDLYFGTFEPLTDPESIRRRIINQSSRCVANEISGLLAKNERINNKVKELEEENRKLRLMIDNGIGWEDLHNDIIGV